LFEEAELIHQNNAVLIKDCTFLELFLLEPKSEAKHNVLLIIYDCIIDLIDLLNVDWILLLNKS